MGKKVRATVVAAAATGALLFGGGVAAAAPASVPATPVTPAKVTNPYVDSASKFGTFVIKYSEWRTEKFIDRAERTTCYKFLPRGACK